jgi:hypothetical protein
MQEKSLKWRFMSWITWGQARAYSALQAGPAGTLYCKPGSFFAGSLGWRGLVDTPVGWIHDSDTRLVDTPVDSWH